MAQPTRIPHVRLGVSYADAIKGLRPQTAAVVGDCKTDEEVMAKKLEDMRIATFEFTTTPMRLAIAQRQTERALRGEERSSKRTKYSRFLKTATKQAKEASFMGLPSELRLHIYSFIPTPIFSWTLGQNHCCEKYKERLACYCAIRDQQQVTAILAVNRQIFREALPVLYRNSEVHISSCDIVPAYAAKHVREVAVFARDRPNGRLDGKESLCDKQDTSLEWMWEYFTYTYTSMQELRIHYQTFGIIGPVEVTAADKTALQGIVMLPQLKKVVLECHHHNALPGDDSILPSVGRRGRIAEFLQQEAEKMGKAIVVEEKLCGGSVLK